jgi:hypothetical protein
MSATRNSGSKSSGLLKHPCEAQKQGLALDGGSNQGVKVGVQAVVDHAGGAALEG